ncbi:MAG: Zn-dependent hydrolase [Flavobacteriaceae bacterium]
MRRTLIALFTLATLAGHGQGIKINTERLSENWRVLQSFGFNEATKGNDRIAFSDYNLEAVKMIDKKLTSLGMHVKIDAAGNLIATLDGKNNQLPPIAFGSHVDCVPNGGHYDGQVGVLGAIEIIETLVENNVRTNHPLELIVFSNEESGVFGSRALAGALTEASLEVMTPSGFTNAQGAERLGGDAKKILSIARKPGSLHAFLELHIEQGGILEEKELDIGIVQGIVGLRWWDVTVEGTSNHGGTTPMNKRQDALLAAAKFVQLVNAVVTSVPGSQVGTVGRIKAFPGAPNVIPGKVILSLELRDLSEDKIDGLFSEIKTKTAEIAADSKVKFSFSPISATGKAALTDKRIQAIIQKEAENLNFTYQYMPSGAGHDAQEMSHIAPTGMIFIPSKAGISHAPEEYSSFKDIGQGTQLLLNTILSLDQLEKF